PAVVFECVGVPGVLDQIMVAAPRGTRVVVVGVCMEPDTIHPLLAIGKELNLQFVLGYTPEEFAATLRHIADGAIPVAPLLTGRVGLGGVAAAFQDLASPDRHAKILVGPGRAWDGGRAPARPHLISPATVARAWPRRELPARTASFSGYAGRRPAHYTRASVDALGRAECRPPADAVHQSI